VQLLFAFLPRRVEKVSPSPSSKDIARVAGIILQLLTKVPDVETQVAVFIQAFCTPDSAQQLLTGHDMSWGFRQTCEEVEFSAGEFYEDTLTPDLLAMEVYSQGAIIVYSMGHRKASADSHRLLVPGL